MYIFVLSCKARCVPLLSVRYGAKEMTTVINIIFVFSSIVQMEAEWSIWQSLVLGRTQNRVGYSVEPSTRPEAEWSLRQSIPVPVPSHNPLYLHFILSGKGVSGVQSQQH